MKELEEKLHALEAEKQAAETKAADDAKSTVEAQAKAKGQEVDQAAVLRAEEEARQKTRKEQERKQQEETKRLEDQKRAEEARIAEERRRAEETAAAAQRAAAERAAAEQAQAAQAAAQAAAQTTPPPTTAAPEPPPTTAAAGPAALRPGTLVNVSDPGVIAPILEKKPQLAYPPIALRQRVEGTVSLNVLVDERGNVTDAQVLSTGGGKSGLPEAAADYAKRWKYRAATKDGVPVKVWTEVKVVFKLPAQ